jgi:hypothetical protein
LNDGRSLLDYFYEGEMTFLFGSQWIEDWIAKAVYVSETILAWTTQPDVAKLNREIMPAERNPEVMKRPVFSGPEIDVIAQIFRK